MIRLPLFHLAGKKAYTLGPMTGYPDHNRPAFRRAKDILRGADVRVLCPDELDTHDPIDTEDWADYLVRDIRWVIQADAAVALPGWRESKGATLEATILGQLGRPVFELVKDRREWVLSPVEPDQMPFPIHPRCHEAGQPSIARTCGGNSV